MQKQIVVITSSAVRKDYGWQENTEYQAMTFDEVIAFYGSGYKFKKILHVRSAIDNKPVRLAQHEYRIVNTQTEVA